MITLELRFLGEMQIRMGEKPLTALKPIKGQALLSYLAVTGKEHSRSALAGLFWTDVSEDKARTNLRKTLFRVKPVLSPYLTITREGIAFNQKMPHRLDVAEFEVNVSPGSEITRLQEAVSLYRGDFLDGFYLPDAPLFDEWLLTQRAHLREVLLRGLKVLLTHFTTENDYDMAISYARRLLDIESWQEDIHRELMTLFALTDRRSAALIQYERCRQVLFDELGVEPADETKSLYERIRDGDLAFTPSQDIFKDRLVNKEVLTTPNQEFAIERERFITNLRPQFSNFVGREKELDSLEDLIIQRGSRLVTLVGPGGIGKTRLALEFAGHQLQSLISPNQKRLSAPTHFPNGIFFISLESIASAEMIWAAIAEALRFRLDYGEIQLIEYLSLKKLLLVMDNFEHILDGAENLSRIIKSAPGIHFLVTSREQLRLLEEQVYPLQGLEYPEPTLAESIVDYPAGKLFFQTAQHRRPDFTLEESETESLTRICQQVEGMPLAIELAACWTDTLSISDICDEIQNNMDFLKTNYRNFPPRHHSLRAVFDVSWEKLLSAEREMFSKLSIFRGGFTREAASQMTGADPQSLAALVHKSLLRYSKSQDRFSIHELLRLYGEQKLFDQSIDLKGLKDRHSQYFCNWFADQVNPTTMRSKGQKAVLDGMRAELENTRAAWDWALQNQDIERLINGRTALGLYYAWRGGFKEGERTFQAFDNQLVNLDSGQDSNNMRLRADILNWRAYFLNELGDRPKAIDLLLESQDLIDSLNSAGIDTRAVQAHNLINKSRSGWWQTTDERKAQLNQAIVLYREVASPYGLPFALNTRANMALVTGQMDEAHNFFTESLNLYERTGNLLGKAAVLNGLGNLAFAKNDYQDAESLLKQTIHIADEIEDRQRDTSATLSLGCVYLYAGQFKQAQKFLKRCVAENTEMGLKNRRAAALYYLGYTCLHLGEYDQAVRYGETALWLAKETDYKEIIAQSMMLPAAIALMKGDFAEAMQMFKAAKKEFVAKRFTRVLYGEDCGLLGLGAATLLLGRVDEAVNIFKELLQQAVALLRQEQLLYALAGIAILFAYQGKKERTIELYALASRHPFVGQSYWFADAFGQLIDVAINQLPSDVVKQSRVRGASSDLWGTAEELQKEFHLSKGREPV